MDSRSLDFKTGGTGASKPRNVREKDFLNPELVT